MPKLKNKLGKSDRGFQSILARINSGRASFNLVPITESAFRGHAIAASTPSLPNKHTTERFPSLGLLEQLFLPWLAPVPQLLEL